MNSKSTPNETTKPRAQAASLNLPSVSEMLNGFTNDGGSGTTRLSRPKSTAVPIASAPGAKETHSPVLAPSAYPLRSSPPSSVVKIKPLTTSSITNKPTPSSSIPVHTSTNPSAGSPTKKAIKKRTEHPSAGYGYEHDSVPGVHEYPRTRQRTDSSVETVRVKDGAIRVPGEGGASLRVKKDKVKEREKRSYAPYSRSSASAVEKVRYSYARCTVSSASATTASDAGRMPHRITITDGDTSTSASTTTKTNNSLGGRARSFSTESLSSATWKLKEKLRPFAKPKSQSSLSSLSLSATSLSSRTSSTDVPPTNTTSTIQAYLDALPSITTPPSSPNNKRSQHRTLAPKSIPGGGIPARHSVLYKPPSPDLLGRGTTLSAIRSTAVEDDDRTGGDRDEYKGRRGVVHGDKDKVRSGSGSGSSYHRNPGPYSTTNTHTATQGLTGIFGKHRLEKENTREVLDTLLNSSKSTSTSTSSSLSSTSSSPSSSPSSSTSLTSVSSRFEDGVLPLRASTLSGSRSQSTAFLPHSAPTLEPLRATNVNTSSSTELPELKQGKTDKLNDEELEEPPTPVIPFRAFKPLSELEEKEGIWKLEEEALKCGQGLRLPTPPGTKKDAHGRVQLPASELRLYVVFEHGMHLEFWDLDDHDFLVCPAKLFLVPKHGKKYAPFPLASPDPSISVIDIKCRPHSCPSSQYQCTEEENEEFEIKYLGATTRDEKGNVLHVPIRSNMEHQVEIVIDPKWQRLHNLPDVVKKITALTSSSSYSSSNDPMLLDNIEVPDINPRGWYLDIFIPLPAKLFLKRETRMFSVIAHLSMDEDDDLDSDFDEYPVAVKRYDECEWKKADHMGNGRKVDAGVRKPMEYLTDDESEEPVEGEDTLMAFGMMTVSHLRREREMNCAKDGSRCTSKK